MKYFLICWMLLATCGAAFGWEADMKASYSLEQYYVSRMGPNDLFGNVTAVQTLTGNPFVTSIGMAGPLSNQVVVEGLSSKGSDGSWTSEKLLFDLSLIANKAVSLRSRITFQGDLNGPFSSNPSFVSPPHYNGGWRSVTRSEETKQAIAMPVLNYVYGEWKTPLGVLTFGRMPFAFGTGWSGLHGEDSTITAIMIKVPYGPFDFFASQGFGQVGNYSSPYDTRNQNLGLYSPQSSTDRNEIKKWESLYASTFSHGPMVIGGLLQASYWNNTHTWPQGPGTFRDDQNAALPSLFLNSFVSVSTNQQGQDTVFPIYGDTFLGTGVLFAKYYDGRFFANLEWDQQYVIARRIGGRPISGWPKAGFAEGGVFFGPMKFTVVGAFRSGHDRTGGVLDVVSTSGTNTQTATQVSDRWSKYLVYAGGGEALKPYTTLLYIYGCGDNGYDNIGNATFTNFKGVGGRFDYAMAANMNLWCSYLYARRASNTENFWGQFNGGIGTASIRGSNVSSDGLGQEGQVGIDWKLLEAASVHLTGSVWQPGAWFKQAYNDYSVVSGIQDPVSNQTTFINPNRGISPILGIKAELRTVF